MPEGQEAPPQPQTEASKAPKISPALLQLLDLTPEDVKVYEEKAGPIIRERKASDLKGQGATDYDNLREKIETRTFQRREYIASPGGIIRSYIKLEDKGNFKTKIELDIHEEEEKDEMKQLRLMPDAALYILQHRIKKYAAKRPKVLEGKDKVLFQLKEWLRGFGERALERDDWETAVRALDLATDGDFINEPKVIDRLKEIAGDDKIKRVEIASLIQHRLDKRPQAATT